MDWISYNVQYLQILAHADSDSKTCTATEKLTTSHLDKKEESTTILYPASMTEIETDLIASLLRGPPALRLGACVEESMSMSTSTSLPVSVELCEEEEMRLSGTDGLGSSSDDFLRNTIAPSSAIMREHSAACCRRLKDHCYFEGVSWGHLLERQVPASFWITGHATHGGGGGAYEGFTYSVSDPNISADHAA